MAKRSTSRRKRQPDVTRERLLQAGFKEIYRRGFQGASLDTILDQAGVTKGALYHHFPDKAALGYAVVDEVVRDLLLQRWLGVLQAEPGDPVTALQGMLKHRVAQLQPHEVELGCPLNNLGQEMSPLDERFRRRVAATFETWTEGFAQVLQQGQTEGSVRRDAGSSQAGDFPGGSDRGLIRLGQECPESGDAALQYGDAEESTGVPASAGSGQKGTAPFQRNR